MFAPVPAENVVVYYGPEWEKLPEGVYTVRGRVPRAADAVALEPNYPTASEPHVKIGAMALRMNRVRSMKEATQILALEASKRGANAVVRLPQSSDVVHAVALRLSAAEPALSYASAEQILSQRPDAIATYEAKGDAVVRALDPFEPLRIDGTRGTCYAVHAALEKDAVMNRRARRAFGLRVGSSPQLVLGKGSFASAVEAPLSQRSDAVALGCPTTDGPLLVGFNVGYDSARPDADKHLGTGQLVFRVYAKTVDLRTLAEAKAAEDSQRRQADDASRRQHSSKTCLSCSGALSRCSPGTDPGSCGPYSECLFRLGMRVNDCL
jgi:hypothetical protein